VGCVEWVIFFYQLPNVSSYPLFCHAHITPADNAHPASARRREGAGAARDAGPRDRRLGVDGNGG
jgi:hypothetical protein